MTKETLPEALRFADALDCEGHEGMGKAANELRRQHDRIAELEAELVKEAAATAEQKLRADQMTKQHRMQCEIRAQLEACHGCAVQQGYKPAEALQGIGEPATLTDEQIDAAFERMPDGVQGFLKSWGYRQFAREIVELAALKAQDVQLSTAPAAGAQVVMPEPAAYIGTWRPKGLLVDHHICGFTVEGLKNSSPASSFEPLYTEQQVRTLLATGGQGQALEVLGWVHKTKRGKIGNHFYTYEPHCDTAVRDDGGEKIAVIAASGAAIAAQAAQGSE